MGTGGVRTTAKRVVGDEASYGITVKGKGGKDTNDIQDLVDMWRLIYIYTNNMIYDKKVY